MNYLARIKRLAVDSSHIKSVGWRADDAVLVVEFVTGDIYA